MLMNVDSSFAISQSIEQVKGVNSDIWKLLCAYFVSSMAMTPILFYFTDFCGESIYGGSAGEYFEVTQATHVC